MRDVYSIVLNDEFIPQSPMESAEGWVNSLLMQLKLDGFDGLGKDNDLVGTISTNCNAQLSNSCKSLYRHTDESILK
jgi:hypothetical protein